ncbi:hypothetical protein MMC25_003443 [Agyrium rufum]|nr:hypothetical protein [Agyrium rufum]
MARSILPSLLSLYMLPSSLASSSGIGAVANNNTINLNWYPPNASAINDLSQVINGTGVYGFVFSSSTLPPGVPYGTYDWCNMPHVRREEYVVPRKEDGWSLQYVELIHRHHKRTPYAANCFPVESYPWYCDDEGLFFYGEPLNPIGNLSSSTFWSVYTSRSNPFPPKGLNGTCQLPQITREGLDDSHQHGLDLLGVYRDLLNFLPKNLSSRSGEVSYRVTNNVITSQVAGMVVKAMLSPSGPYPLLIQPDSIDSLEPTYTCNTALNLYSTYGSGSTSPAWLAHLNAAASLYAVLDGISGVSPTDSGFHMSFDHYYDNLSARLCHAKPLPCKVTNGQNSTDCVTQAQADEVFRLGQYEYDFQYRSAGTWTLQAAVGKYGVWVAELAANLRAAAAGTSKIKYRHNVAHDGSVSPLLAILQVDVMVWPGMGSEVVFEMWAKKGTPGQFVRILWGGKILRSSNPTLGLVEMVPLSTLLAYFDGLVGVSASRIPGLCEST